MHNPNCTFRSPEKLKKRTKLPAGLKTSGIDRLMQEW